MTAATVSDDERDIESRRDLEGDWHQDEFLCTVAGRDEEGYWHVVDEDRGKVVVIDEDRIDFQHRYEADEGPSRWGQWADHVEAKRGWDETWKVDLMYHMQGDLGDMGGDAR